MSEPARRPATVRLEQVLLVGTGLVGTSIGLGLRPLGVDVVVQDTSPTAQALAADLGAGRQAGPEEELAPDLVVVAAPPDVTAAVVVDALQRYPGALVTDVASTKSGIVADVVALAGDRADRYVGGHPLAGRERSGPMAGRGDLFVGRPWVLTPTERTAERTTRAVAGLVTELGALLVELDPQAHDDAVAVVSHVPQVLASLVAGRLVGADERAVSLAGQGLRDVTRIAASDPVLWAQILSSNARPLAQQLRAVREDLDAAIAALDELGSQPTTGSAAAPTAAGPAGAGPEGTGTRGQRGPRAVLAGLIAEGNSGRELVPGKHGSAPTVYATVPVLMPDRPGELARLVGVIGEVGVNVEDLRMEHSPGRATGVAEVSVLPASRDRLVSSLRERGWAVPD